MNTNGASQGHHAGTQGHFFLVSEQCSETRKKCPPPIFVSGKLKNPKMDNIPHKKVSKENLKNTKIDPFQLRKWATKMVEDISKLTPLL